MRLMAGTFDVSAKYVEVNPTRARDFNYTFDQCGQIRAGGIDVRNFLRDVTHLVAEHAEYARLDAGLRKANREFSDEQGRLNQRVLNLDAALKDAQLTISGQSARNVEQEGELARMHEANDVLQDALKLVAKAKGDLEDERAELLKRIDHQRATIIRYQNSQAGLPEALATAENTIAEMQAEIERLTGALHSCDANFKLADRALSCRNDTIAAMDRQLTAKEEERRLDVKTLKGVIANKNGEIERLRANVTHYACAAADAKKANGRETIKLGVYLHGDGSISVQTEAPVVVTTDNVVFSGTVKACGEVAA